MEGNGTVGSDMNDRICGRKSVMNRNNYDRAAPSRGKERNIQTMIVGNRKDTPGIAT